ncbi:hypothetical protein B4064_1679 [Caldibacillus thermoamylovorans]|uniref:Uncharacterized protein n=1 Tax=Caldibacillus thermoamylovorans TaxID=35841 RepID=A0A0D0EW45_9BACI|nr:hypothetical protein B4064_1679 [Caldibacillus thermoamylovorans]KIO68960.1 hypothetical protein B4065_1564 [Caldibacillus thermoamylovorans]KIO71129.1 hypothetical protein B4166_1415 [Caldibacillus thermoamylovorans]KIO73538.1 hypothetical protein B4167_2014 [Caldibacillus thermoamylovorans]
MKSFGWNQILQGIFQVKKSKNTVTHNGVTVFNHFIQLFLRSHFPTNFCTFKT